MSCLEVVWEKEVESLPAVFLPYFEKRISGFSYCLWKSQFLDVNGQDIMLHLLPLEPEIHQHKALKVGGKNF